MDLKRLARRAPQPAVGFMIQYMVGPSMAFEDSTAEDFSQNCLTDTAAAAFAECLGWIREHFGGQVLSSLSLSQNEITSVGAQALHCRSRKAEMVARSCP